ncbi:MAG: hypothetical protein QM704_20195 [Anaeromyxobacteraceae bacterium]
MAVHTRASRAGVLLAPALLAAALVAACGAPGYRWVVPEGYQGWVEMKCGVTGAPPLPVEGGLAVIVVPQDGKIVTSSPLRSGPARDEALARRGDRLEPVALPVGIFVRHVSVGQPRAGNYVYAYFGTPAQYQAALRDLTGQVGDPIEPGNRPPPGSP